MQAGALSDYLEALSARACEESTTHSKRKVTTTYANELWWVPCEIIRVVKLISSRLSSTVASTKNGRLALVSWAERVADNQICRLISTSSRTAKEEKRSARLRNLFSWYPTINKVGIVSSRDRFIESSCLDWSEVVLIMGQCIYLSQTACGSGQGAPIT